MQCCSCHIGENKCSSQICMHCMHHRSQQHLAQRIARVRRTSVQYPQSGSAEAVQLLVQPLRINRKQDTCNDYKARIQLCLLAWAEGRTWVGA
eukprot:3507371-Amphidinium_carterae.1